MPVMHLCLKCKGRLMCGRERCLFSLPVPRVLEELRATPPSIFVGRTGYPKVFAGPLLSPAENPEYFDSPWEWSGKVEDVVAVRMKVARGMKLVDARAASNPDRYLSELQEAVASVSHLDVEANFSGIVWRPKIDGIAKPAGISVRLEDFKVTENPKIPAKVEKIHYDELKASDSIYLLFRSGFRTYYIQKLLSAGMLGEERNRKLVPTRWSITAVHDTLAERLKSEIAEFPEVNDVLLFEYEHFGNRFSIVIYPSKFSFKLYELWRKGAVWSGDTWIGFDSETLLRKKKYSILSGGYYAARLPVLEYLRTVRRQAGAIVFREITPEYTAPLGVWVVEEGVRKAMNSKPKKFDSLSEALRRARTSVPGKFFRQTSIFEF